VGKNLEYRPKEPGIYRVEAYKGKKGWIFSNHIRVVSDTSPLVGD
jgi:hypothetical protein